MNAVCAKLSEYQSGRFCVTEKKMDIMWVISFFLFQLYKNKDSKSVTGEGGSCLPIVFLSNIVLTKIINIFVWIVK